jgi:caffeoyl-CoA O-methyltransferase
VHRNKIEMIKGNAREIIPGIDQMFDLVYMDADKLQYQFYFENILPKVNSGGIIITDNVLWDGTVLYPQDHKAQAIADFNKAVSTDERVDQVMLPVRDGIFVIRKK